MTKQASSRRAGLSWTTLRRNAWRGRVWIVSKLMTLSVGNTVICHSEGQLRRQASAGAGERGNNHGANAIGNGIAGKHEHRTIAPWGVGKPDLTPLHRPTPTSLQQVSSARPRRRPVPQELAGSPGIRGHHAGPANIVDVAYATPRCIISDCETPKINRHLPHLLRHFRLHPKAQHRHMASIPIYDSALAIQRGITPQRGLRSARCRGRTAGGLHRLPGQTGRGCSGGGRSDLGGFSSIQAAILRRPRSSSSMLKWR